MSIAGIARDPTPAGLNRPDLGTPVITGIGEPQDLTTDEH
jgi:hypothetical protein